MSESFARIAAIVQADFRIRFRRLSTLVVFLLISAVAYLWIPAPSTGRALIQINGHRALYNSGAIGLGTASIGMIFVGLFGFYVISNTIRRDITTRCGLIAASTPMRSLEYLLGKFIGNLTFLVVFLAGFMLTSMAMLFVRGEARFEPWIFIEQYLLLTPAAIVFVSAVAVLFESIPWLAGKFGDVVYFFLWATIIGLVVGNEISHHAINWARCFDFTGFGFMIDQMQHTLHTDSVSIGAAPFDAKKAPILFPGLTMTRDWILPRLISICAPLLLLPLALLFFHRFDPVRVGRVSEKGGRNWLGRFQALLKPITRRATAAMFVLGRASSGSSLGGAIWNDMVLTFTLYPLAFVALVAANIVALCAPLDGVLPTLLAALALVVSDIATRDVRAGTTASLRAIPRLRENFVWWKFGATLLLGFFFCAAALARTIPRGPLALVALFVAIFFVAALGTALGVLTTNPKTFIVAFLSFWYLVINDRGAHPIWDFADAYGRATPATIVAYAGVGLFALIAAQIFHRFRLTNA